jgi:hypothetical protein
MRLALPKYSLQTARQRSAPPAATLTVAQRYAPDPVSADPSTGDASHRRYGVYCKMTTRDQIYNYIKEKNGAFSKEICDHFGYSDMRVFYHTKFLRKLGLIYVADWVSRRGKVASPMFKEGNLPNTPKPESVTSIKRRMRKSKQKKSSPIIEPENKPSYLPNNWFTLTPKNGETGAKPNTLQESPSE